MLLSQAQRAVLTAEAQKRGLDPEALIAAAEEELAASAEEPKPRADDEGGGGAKPSHTDTPQAPKSKAPLFAYLLPFVTVDEVRTIWLELEPMAGEGGSENAAKWAAKMSSTQGSTDGT